MAATGDGSNVFGRPAETASERLDSTRRSEKAAHGPVLRGPRSKADLCADERKSDVLASDQSVISVNGYHNHANMRKEEELLDSHRPARKHQTLPQMLVPLVQTVHEHMSSPVQTSRPKLTGIIGVTGRTWSENQCHRQQTHGDDEHNEQVSCEHSSSEASLITLGAPSLLPMLQNPQTPLEPALAPIQCWDSNTPRLPARTLGQIASFHTFPSPEILVAAADVYFQYCHNQPYSLFHEQSFRNRLTAGNVPKHLALAFLATTLRFSSDPCYQHNRSEAISAYASESWKAICLPWNGVENAAGLGILQTIFLLSVIDYTGK